MNTFFPTIISNTSIPEYLVCVSISSDLNETVLKFILKYKNHSSIKEFKTFLSKTAYLSFSM